MESSQAMVKLAEVMKDSDSTALNAFTNSVNQGYQSVGRRVIDAEVVHLGQNHFEGAEIQELKSRKKNDTIHKEEENELVVTGCKEKNNETTVFFVQLYSSSVAFHLIVDSFATEEEFEKLIDAMKPSGPNTVKVKYKAKYINGELKEGRFSNFV